MRETPVGRTRPKRRHRRVTASASAVLVFALGVAACSSGSSSSTGGSAGGQVAAASSKYPWCGPKQASIALADGFGDNTWRELTRYSAVTIAAECPSVTKYVYTNGEGNTQKAISDINSLVAQGITAIVDFPDAGEAMLPVLTKAYQAGTIVVPYRVFPGGQASQNYNAYLSTNFTSAGVLWGQDVATALHGTGNVVFLGGPPANSQSLAEYQGLQSVFKNYPGIHIIGQKPYNVTNWDPATTEQVVASLLSKYPKIDAVVSDFGTALAASFPQFQKAGGRSRLSPPKTGTRSAATGPRCTRATRASASSPSPRRPGWWNTRYATPSPWPPRARFLPPPWFRSRISRTRLLAAQASRYAIHRCRRPRSCPAD